MAIKAIINNTEKEIEQIKNSDEQDIDYVYSRIGDTEVEGEPPISIKSIGGNLADYRIYGNTVGGAGVGDLVESGEHAGEYEVPVTVEGKNLFDENNANIIKGYFNSQTFNIISSSINRTIYIPCLPNTTYTLTKSVQKTTSANRFRACTTTEIPTNNVVINDYVAYSDGTTETNLSITTGANARYLCCFIYSIDAEMAFEKILETIQIEKNFSATPYEPYHAPVTTNLYLPEQIKMVGNEPEYVDYAEQKLHRVRKNLLQNTATSQTISGVTFTVNEDGSVTCNGTATDNAFLVLKTMPNFGGTCILTGCPLNGSAGTYCVQYSNMSTDAYNDIGSGVRINKYSSIEYPSARVQIKISAGYTCDNLTFYPMIRKADIEDDTYEPYIENTEVNTNLPALSTIKGTNILSVNTSIQPSNIYIKDSFDYKKVFTATRTIEDELPLNYRNIEDNDSTLDNYRIYGNTAGGESVGDRTGNLFDKSGSQYGNNLHWVPARGLVYSDAYYGSPIMDVTGLNTITRSYTGTSANYFLTSDLSQFVNVSNVGTVDAGVTVNVPDGYTKYVFNIPNTIRPDSIMVNSGSTPLPYEPYGYKVPVTISNGTDMQTIPIYLPEQIKKVGDEAEYIDYGEQKQHRVRKNLLPNNGTSYTTSVITATKNDDGSVTISNHGEESVQVTWVYYNSDDVLFKAGTQIIISTRYTASISFKYSDNTWSGSISQNQVYTIPKDIIMAYSQFYINADEIHTFYPMIRKADIEDDTYEPYIENTDLDVTLPALPTIKGTNVLSVGTAVQPSRVYVKGKIKEIN